MDDSWIPGLTNLTFGISVILKLGLFWLDPMSWCLINHFLSQRLGLFWLNFGDRIPFGSLLGLLAGVPIERPRFRFRFLDLDLGNLSRVFGWLLGDLAIDPGDSFSGLGWLLGSLLGTPLGWSMCVRQRFLATTVGDKEFGWIVTPVLTILGARISGPVTDGDYHLYWSVNKLSTATKPSRYPRTPLIFFRLLWFLGHAFPLEQGWPTANGIHKGVYQKDRPDFWWCWNLKFDIFAKRAFPLRWLPKMESKSVPSGKAHRS